MQLGLILLLFPAAVLAQPASIDAVPHVPRAPWRVADLADLPLTPRPNLALNVLNYVWMFIPYDENGGNIAAATSAKPFDTALVMASAQPEAVRPSIMVGQTSAEVRALLGEPDSF